MFFIVSNILVYVLTLLCIFLLILITRVFRFSTKSDQVISAYNDLENIINKKGYSIDAEKQILVVIELLDKAVKLYEKLWFMKNHSVNTIMYSQLNKIGKETSILMRKVIKKQSGFDS